MSNRNFSHRAKRDTLRGGHPSAARRADCVSRAAPRASTCGSRAEPRVGTLIVASLISLSSACGGGDEGNHMVQQGPVVAADAGLGDSGFPNPVFVPPANMMPVNDAGGPSSMLPVNPFPTVMDAGRPDAGPSREAGAGITNEAGTFGDPSASNPCGTEPEPLAANIRITEVSIYQTVKIPLFKSDAWVPMRNATVVQGKKSLVRAFVAPQSGYAPHALRGLLTLESDGKRVGIASDRMISAASTDENANSTFDFQVDGSLLTGSTQLSVSVLETTCMPPAASPGARVPATGAQMLNADAVGKFRVVVVPVTLAGRTPDTSTAQLERLRNELLAYYPVADVEVTAHAPVSFSGTAASSGTGWSEVLALVQRTRQQDMPASSVYYYGLITPAATFRDYCRSGCVAGLAPQTVTVSRSNQIGLGVGFADNNTASTMAHELGHAHGLPHAPCTRGGTIQGADSRFPYMGAKIGSWGWDSRSNKLMSPATYVDLMSYCEPVWISDYNYVKLTARAKAVNTAAFVYAGDLLQTWQSIILHADGSARWTGVTSDELPGEASTARVLDAQGHVLSQIEVARVTLSHTDDTFLYLPAPGARWAAIDLGDRVLELKSVEAVAE
jgi:hypothetical protein